MAYQIPRGCQDVFGNESYKWQALEQTLRSFCYMYNYDEIRTPIFEHTDCLLYTSPSPRDRG